ncbi:MAG: hypothetical protein JJ858_06930 [Rhizobiaceae bacterium]|nr:hypothetical protein [Rhizobiaceae bacterium]
MDRERFFQRLCSEHNNLFPDGLTESQSHGLNVKLDVWAKWYAHHPITYLAAALGQIYHETGGLMVPVLEAFAPDRKTSVERLEKAYAEGRLSWVKQPYWYEDQSGQHPVGCGDIQITHRKNYVAAEENLNKKFGVQTKLADNYDLALDPVMSAHIAFSGMIDGWFRPCKLSDFESEAGLDYRAARDIVNGDTGLIGEKIENYCKIFEDALRHAGADKSIELMDEKLDWPKL